MNNYCTIMYVQDKNVISKSEISILKITHIYTYILEQNMENIRFFI